MDAIAIDELITQGVSFTLTVDDMTYAYRSYQYQRGTYIKFVRPNGTEVHLGRYTPNGMNFNKKYGGMRQTRKNLPYTHIRWFLESVKERQLNGHVVFNVVLNPQPPPPVLTKEEKAELLDTREYLYRIGVSNAV